MENFRFLPGYVLVQGFDDRWANNNLILISFGV